MLDSLSRPLGLWGVVVLYMAGIFAVSSISQPPLPPGPVTDKHWHALAYAGLASLWVRALARQRWADVTARVCLWAAVVSIAYGASDEWHQSFVPGREASVWDLVADTAGAFGAAASWYACGIIARSWRGPLPREGARRAGFGGTPGGRTPDGA